MTLPVNDAVPGAVRHLRQSLRVPGLARAVAAYFRPEEHFAGLSFTCLGSNPRDAVTASDLLAVSLLDIAWRPEAVRQLLDTSAAMVSALLSAIRSDTGLWEASDEDLAAVDPLWDALLQMPGVGTAAASKLLARKRPRLCPVSDKVVIGAVGVPGWTWEALRAFLQDPAARAEIEALRPPSAAVVSVLRILDVAIWIRHSHSRAASRIRRDSGIPEPGTAARNTRRGRACWRGCRQSRLSVSAFASAAERILRARRLGIFVHTEERRAPSNPCWHDAREKPGLLTCRVPSRSSRSSITFTSSPGTRLRSRRSARWAGSGLSSS